MARPSSTKKAAKLAQKGKGRKVRFQGGTVFPAAVAITLMLGFALIVYSRQTLPEADSSPPTINDHWHAAYGFYLCDTWYKLAGNLEETNSAGQLANPGIRPHRRAQPRRRRHALAPVHGRRRSATNAVLGVFLDTYDVELTNDTLKFPDNNVLGFSRRSTRKARRSATARTPSSRSGPGAATPTPTPATATSPTWTASTSTTTAWCSASTSPPRTLTSRCRRGRPSCPQLGAVDTGQVAPTTIDPGLGHGVVRARHDHRRRPRR